ncbi:alpha/beta fold hydrolase [Aquicella siphonis]|nr:alpha/beta fold hydrolase [Aquicella siphonis]
MKDDVVFLEKTAKGLFELSQVHKLEYQYNTRKKVYECGKVKLYHYQPKEKKPHSIPVLVVFATVNRPEILDLFPDHSFIGGLLDNGMDVYLLDWGYPDAGDYAISINDYITHYLHLCVQQVIERSRQPRINLAGICQGGLICLCYSILFQTIKKLVLISAPVDFQTEDNVIGKIFKKIDVEALIRLTGNIPGMWLTQFFISLRPFELVGKKYLRYLDKIEDKSLTERFLRVEKWLYDAPDQTAASFRSLISDFYQRNKLVKGTYQVNGKRIKLKNLAVPVFNVMASEDEIVPVSATRVLKDYVDPSLYIEKLYPSGHIGIYISDRVGKSMPHDIAVWLKDI